MKQYSGLICFVLCILFSGLAEGQNIEFRKGNFPGRKDEFKKAMAEYRLGDNSYLQEMYTEALDHYLKADEFNPQNGELNYKTGKCYLKSLDKTSAIPYLEKANELTPNAYNDLHYLLGRAYHLNSEWDKAVSEYDVYNASLHADALADKEKVKKRIKECEIGRASCRERV